MMKPPCAGDRGAKPKRGRCDFPRNQLHSDTFQQPMCQKTSHLGGFAQTCASE
jgi:hypothetical protein